MERGTAKDNANVIFDVRTDEEVAEGILENAINFDIKPQEFMAALEKWTKKITMSIVRGSRSSQLVRSWIKWVLRILTISQEAIATWDAFFKRTNRRPYFIFQLNDRMQLKNIHNSKHDANNSSSLTLPLGEDMAVHCRKDCGLQTSFNSLIF
jgi:hypothetical protein